MVKKASQQVKVAGLMRGDSFLSTYVELASKTGGSQAIMTHWAKWAEIFVPTILTACLVWVSSLPHGPLWLTEFGQGSQAHALPRIPKVPPGPPKGTQASVAYDHYAQCPPMPRVFTCHLTTLGVFFPCLHRSPPSNPYIHRSVHFQPAFCKDFHMRI